MKLVTAKQREQLIRNGKNPDADQMPVLKIFNPAGSATWLITQMDPEEPDIMFGLCDLGQDCAELGSVRLSELESIETAVKFQRNGQTVTSKTKMKLERDLHFKPKHPLSVYSEAAWKKRGITEIFQDLENAANRIGPARDQLGLLFT